MQVNNAKKALFGAFLTRRTGWYGRGAILPRFYAPFATCFAQPPEGPRLYLLTSSGSLGLWQTHPVQQVSVARVGANVIPIRINFHEQNSRPCFITFI